MKDSDPWRGFVPVRVARNIADMRKALRELNKACQLRAAEIARLRDLLQETVAQVECGCTDGGMPGPDCKYYGLFTRVSQELHGHK